MRALLKLLKSWSEWDFTQPLSSLVLVCRHSSSCTAAAHTPTCLLTPQKQAGVPSTSHVNEIVSRSKGMERGFY